MKNDFSSDYVLGKLGALMANPSRDNLYENSLGAINLAIKKINELDSQVEKMRRFGNCQHNRNCWFVLGEKCPCDKWEMQDE